MAQGGFAFGLSTVRLSHRPSLGPFLSRHAVEIVLIGLTLGVYLQVRHFEFFQVDDPIFVSMNPHIRSGTLVANVKWAFTHFYSGNWMPLTYLSYMLDWSLYDLWAGGFHITNVLFHIANVLLLYYLWDTLTGNRFLASFVAALFAGHPIHAESVAWITERRDVLSVFFGLASILCYAKYAKGARTGAYWLSLCLYVCSLCSKQTLVTLPCVLLLIDYWPLRRLSRRTVVEKLPFFAVSLGLCVIVFRAQVSGGFVEPMASYPLSMRLANAAVAYLQYLQKAFAPYNLSILYPYPTTTISLWTIGLATAFLVTATFLAFKVRDRFPFFTVGWLWFLGTFVPLIGIVQIGTQQMADHYAYFPLIGIYLAFAGFVRSRSLAIVLVSLLALVGYHQVSYWRDTETLVNHAIATVNPWVARCVSGAQFIKESEVPQALARYREAVQVAPDQAKAYCELADALTRTGHIEEGRSNYIKTLAINPDYANAHEGMGWYHIRKKNFPLGELELQRAIDLAPMESRHYLDLAEVYKIKGRFERSIALCEEALKINDQSMAAYHLIADNLRGLERWKEAADILAYIMAQSPDDAEAIVKYERTLKSALLAEPDNQSLRTRLAAFKEKYE
jgi:tetratricopeptide (TPR) repeat protein